MASKHSISRRSFLKAVGAGSAAVAAAGVLTACGGSSSSTASSAASTAASAAPATTELAAEQVLNLIYTDLALIDVNDVRNSNEFEVLTAVQEGLFRTFTDENGVDVVENAGCCLPCASPPGAARPARCAASSCSCGNPSMCRRPR